MNEDQAEGIQHAWRDAVERYTPRAPDTYFHWSARDISQAKRLCIEWAGSPDELCDLISWSVRNWLMVVIEQLSWCDNPKAPRVPVWGFFYGHRKTFVGAWSSSKLDRLMPEYIKRGRPMTHGPTEPDEALMQLMHRHRGEQEAATRKAEGGLGNPAIRVRTRPEAQEH